MVLVQQKHLIDDIFPGKNFYTNVRQAYLR